MPDDLKTENKAAFAAQAIHSQNEAITLLADLVNEHTFLLAGLFKKLGTNPAEILALLEGSPVVLVGEDGKDVPVS